MRTAKLGYAGAIRGQDLQGNCFACRSTVSGSCLNERLMHAQYCSPSIGMVGD